MGEQVGEAGKLGTMSVVSRSVLVGHSVEEWQGKVSGLRSWVIRSVESL